MWAEQVVDNSPTNLGMKAAFAGPHTQQKWNCGPVTNGRTYREWNMANATLVIESSDVSDNLAGSSNRRKNEESTTPQAGGGIHATNLQLTLKATNITHNHAVEAGGVWFHL